jgi:hypothetical protein
MPYRLFLLLASCAHQPSTAQLDAPPSLPAPQSRIFQRAPGTPSDPAVARLVGGVRWDTALSGAAGGLGVEASMGVVSYQSWEVREAAWKAGYPIPVKQVRAWTTPVGGAPPAELLDWLATVDEATDIGLVRTRSPETDAWVALAARPRLELPAFPREGRVGTELRFPPLPGFRLVWSDPVGGLDEASLDTERVIGLHTPGCWLIDVRDEQGTAARFPVWVGVSPPDIRLYDLPDLPSDPLERAGALLDEARALAERPEWIRDPTLDLVAQKRLAEPDGDLAEMLDHLGYDSSKAGSFSCEGPTLEACIDQVLWRPESRRAIVAPQRLSGLALEAKGGGVRLVGLVAPE